MAPPDKIRRRRAPLRGPWLPSPEGPTNPGALPGEQPGPVTGTFLLAAGLVTMLFALAVRIATS